MNVTKRTRTLLTMSQINVRRNAKALKVVVGAMSPFVSDGRPMFAVRLDIIDAVCGHIDGSKHTVSFALLPCLDNIQVRAVSIDHFDNVNAIIKVMDPHRPHLLAIGDNIGSITVFRRQKCMQEIMFGMVIVSFAFIAVMIYALILFKREQS